MNAFVIIKFIKLFEHGKSQTELKKKQGGFSRFNIKKIIRSLYNELKANFKTALVFFTQNN